MRSVDVLHNKVQSLPFNTNRQSGQAGVYRDEQVRHSARVLDPRVAVFDLAALNVSMGAVADHGGEEEGVEPWKGALEARDQRPRQGKVHVASVM